MRTVQSRSTSATIDDTIIAEHIGNAAIRGRNIRECVYVDRHKARTLSALHRIHGVLTVMTQRKVQHTAVYTVWACLLSILPITALAEEIRTPIHWSTLANGVQKTTLRKGKAYAFRIDLRKAKLTISQSKEGKYVHELAKATPAIIATNGNFFDPQYRVQGLTVSDKQRLSRFKHVDWGVFSIQNHTAKIVHSRQWSSRKEARAEFAVQCGPRLVVNNRIVSLKPQWARRTAIGVEKRTSYVLLLVVDERILTSELAHMMKRLGAQYAMNLDGGSSTQLWTRDAKHAQLEGVPVANAILVSGR